MKARRGRAPRPTLAAFGCALIALATASCVPPPSAPPAAAAPAPPPIPAPPAIPAVTELRLGDFAFRGALQQGGLAIGTAPPGATAITFEGAPIPLAPDGRFLIGFGRDFAAIATVEARLADGSIRRQVLTIAPGHWQIENLPTLPKGTTPTPEFLARRKIELERIGAARRIASESDGWAQTFRWPVIGRLSGLFGAQRIYAGEPGEPHSGADVARPTGTPVAAPADGVVVLAAESPFTLEGNLLMVDHGMGLNSAFLHLSRIDVRVGDHVRQGQILGAIGMTGRATGPHLHWALKWRDQRIDPLLVAGPMPKG